MRYADSSAVTAAGNSAGTRMWAAEMESREWIPGCGRGRVHPTGGSGDMQDPPFSSTHVN